MISNNLEREVAVVGISSTVKIWMMMKRTLGQILTRSQGLRNKNTYERLEIITIISTETFTGPARAAINKLTVSWK